jgi:hypothetical protein
MIARRSSSATTDADQSADRRNRPDPCTCSTGIGRVLPGSDSEDKRAVPDSSGNRGAPHRRRNSRSSTNSSRTGSFLRGRIPSRARRSDKRIHDAAGSSHCRTNTNCRTRSVRRPPGVTGPERPQEQPHSRRTTGKPDRSQDRKPISDSWFAVPPKFRCCCREGANTSSDSEHPRLLSAKRPSPREKSSLGPIPARSSKSIELAETLQTR